MSDAPTVQEILDRPIETPPKRGNGKFPHTISFRVSEEQMQLALAFRSAFPAGTFSECFQWFLSSDEGRELIKRKVRGEI